MEITKEDVKSVEETLETVRDLKEYAEMHDSDAFDKQNLHILEVQLESVYQALSLIAVAEGNV